MTETLRSQLLFWTEMDVKGRLKTEREKAEILSEKSRKAEHFAHCKDEGEVKLIVFVLFTFLSLAFYIVDLGFDIYWLVTFYIEGDYLYFCCTLAFLVIPAVIIMIRSLVFNNNEWVNKNENTYDPRDFLPKKSKCSFAMWLVGFVCPVLRYWNVIKYAYKFKQTKAKTDDDTKTMYFLAMIWEDAELNTLRQFDCFLESAPQLLLSLCVMVKGGYYFGVSSMIFPIFSVISLTFALVSYDRKIRLMKEIKREYDNRQNQSSDMSVDDITNAAVDYIEIINIKNSALLFSANFFWIVSRLIALSLFASTNGWVVWLACLCHLIPTFVWHWNDNSYSFIDSLRLSFVHLFAFLYPLESESDQQEYPRLTPSIYQLICFFENVHFMMQWSKSFIKEDGKINHEILTVWTFLVPCIVQFTTMISSFVLFSVVKKLRNRNSINFSKQNNIEVQ